MNPSEFDLDWLAEDAAEAERQYREAIEAERTDPRRWSCWISYLATRGRFKEAKENWRMAVETLNVTKDGTPDQIFLSLHRWVARWLLHWAELDFADEVLRAIPRKLAENDASIQALWDLLTALREAKRGVSVFPLSVPAGEWWSPSPHTDLPPRWDGLPLRDWVPARVEGIDQENEVAFLVAAKRPATTDGKPVYFETELNREEITKAASGFNWDDIHEGTFVELGYYGDRSELMRIGLHRATTWNDPHLLPLFPPTDRWYRRAVEQAWTDVESQP